MPTVAIIPARGGSKGIPGKNLARVGGVPLVARTVAAARGAARVDRVVVSTDDAGIAAVARDAGAEIVDRPAALSSDHSSSEDAVLHTLEWCVTSAPGADGDGIALPWLGVVVLLQCTSPFTTADDIDGTVACLDDPTVDCAFTATRTHAFLWRDGGGGDHGVTAVNHDAEVRPRRQDRAAEFLETGAVYAMRAAGFTAARHRFFGCVTIYEVPPTRALEVDTPADLTLAAALAAIPETTE